MSDHSFMDALQKQYCSESISEAAAKRQLIVLKKQKRRMTEQVQHLAGEIRKVLCKNLALSFCFLFLISIQAVAQQKETTPQKDLWVSAYLASYNHFAPPSGNWGNLPTNKIDWNAFTHLFYFSFNIKPDGSLSKIAPYHNMNSDRLKAIVSAAHKAGKPILYTAGGWGNHKGFSTAIKPRNRSRLISKLIQLMQHWGFDGIDLDLEPLKDGDLRNYRAFIKALYQRLQHSRTRLDNSPLLTVATSSHPKFFAKLYPKFDQINLMTYDMSGAWQGWVSWHNSPVYAPHTFPHSNKPLPSIDGTVKKFLKAGIPPEKLGIGIDFYGYVWSGGRGTSTGGVTKPDQSWSRPPVVKDNVAYHKIMDRYYRKRFYHWDKKAGEAYLSIDRPGAENDKFISFDDERTIRAKFKYVKEKHLGGVIVWELGAGYRQNLPVGRRDILLQAVKKSAQNYSFSSKEDSLRPVNHN